MTMKKKYLAVFMMATALTLTACGAKDTAGFVKMIKDAGVDPKVVGVEVISDAILGKGLKEAAAYTYENTEKVLREVWPELVD